MGCACGGPLYNIIMFGSCCGLVLLQKRVFLLCVGHWPLHIFLGGVGSGISSCLLAGTHNRRGPLHGGGGGDAVI